MNNFNLMIRSETITRSEETYWQTIMDLTKPVWQSFWLFFFSSLYLFYQTYFKKGNFKLSIQHMFIPSFILPKIGIVSNYQYSSFLLFFFLFAVCYFLSTLKGWVVSRMWDFSYFKFLWLLTQKMYLAKVAEL